jgi:acetylornithine/succinyldiaminopimelate/putrescine aminotransferase
VSALATDAWTAYTQHVNPGLGKFLAMAGRDLHLVRGEGCTLISSEGERFDDWLGGFGALSLGHDPPGFRQLIDEHLRCGTPNLYPEALNPFAGALAADLLALAGPGFETVYFGNSGSEAVECALKLAVRVSGRPRIAYATHGYHGTTLGALACMGEGHYRRGFDPLLIDHVALPFGDLQAAERALRSGDIAGLLIEPLQVEAGVCLASPEYFAGLRALCDEHGVLLLLDEVQTGLGRTGSVFCFQQLGARPDVLILAKALGAGLLPIGATVVGEGLWERAYGGPLACEAHNSTFGGNALACVVAREAVARLSDPGLLTRVRERGAALWDELRAAIGDSPAVREVRGLGLLGGVELAPVEHPWLTWEAMGLPEFSEFASSGPLLVERLARRGIQAQVCGHEWSVLRVEPPLIVDDEACARFVQAMRAGVTFLEEGQ